MRVLVSRPEPGASATAERLQALGHDPVVAPLFAYEAVEWTPPEDFDAVMLTSAAAVRLGGPRLTEAGAAKPVFAVGTATADTARAAGIEVTAVGDGDVASLMPRIAASGACRVLHVRGADSTRFDPPPETEFIPAIAYRAARREWSRAERVAAETAEVVLAYSARGATALADALACPAKAAQRLAAISAAVAAAAGEGWAKVDVAAAPDEDALFAAAGLLCD